jgi:hypothetical protein
MSLDSHLLALRGLAVTVDKLKIAVPRRSALVKKSFPRDVV